MEKKTTVLTVHLRKGYFTIDDYDEKQQIITDVLSPEKFNRYVLPGNFIIFESKALRVINDNFRIFHVKGWVEILHSKVNIKTVDDLNNLTAIDVEYLSLDDVIYLLTGFENGEF